MSEKLPVRLAADLAVIADEQRWLVRDLWAAQAVGIVGGEPKCCKSFLALDMAVAVAAGKPCLRRFPVVDPGPVLLYAAEDALHVVRRRLEGICAAAGVPLTGLPVHVITARSLRLDHQEDRLRLRTTVEAIKPKLLILDPFVRLHRIDENVSGDVAPLLAHLRDLQRRFHVAVCVVHHARKGAGRVRAGQALRGSSEFHAWGDSNLYMRRSPDHQLVLSVEQRAAASVPAISLELRAHDDSLALHVLDRAPTTEQPPAEPGPADRVEEILAAATAPVPLTELRAACRIRTASLCQTLNDLVRDGRVKKTSDGYALASPPL
jgi:hypothetical protein